MTKHPLHPRDALSTAINRMLASGEPAVDGKPVTHIALSYANGGSGFTGTLQAGRDERYGIYMGDKGAQTRAWWRHYAKANGYKLVEPK